MSIGETTLSKKNSFSKEEKDQLHHILEEQIARISVEEEEERMKLEAFSRDHRNETDIV